MVVVALPTASDGPVIRDAIDSRLKKDIDKGGALTRLYATTESLPSKLKAILMDPSWTSTFLTKAFIVAWTEFGSSKPFFIL